mgnify:CR=1 FL=1
MNNKLILLIIVLILIIGGFLFLKNKNNGLAPTEQEQDVNTNMPVSEDNVEETISVDAGVDINLTNIKEFSI